MIKKLTIHFNLDEFTATCTGLKNDVLDTGIYSNIVRTARILERVRRKFDGPICVNSGYRSPAVNKAVGGKPNSLHLLGRAVDIDIVCMSGERADVLLKLLDDELPVELIKTSRYIHVAY